ncbi:MAG: tetratricopeptide repeat protein [Actinomycetota bacterium]|nr:tetratricopeptide repeat protein [Actinomycetota bacterium]
MSSSAHEFTLVISHPRELTGDDLDALFEAGLDDATFTERDGLIFVDIARKGADALKVISEAIRVLERTLPESAVVRVEPDDLVTLSGIAERTKRSRESVRLLVEGKRGPGDFPRPVTLVDSKSRLWRWSDVARWFHERLGQEVEVGLDTATSLAAINAALELRTQRTRLGEAEHESLEALVGRSLATEIEKHSEKPGPTLDIAGELIGIANPVLGLLAKWAGTKLFSETPIGTAINRTQNLFSGIEIDHSLRKWSTGPAFRDLMARVAVGHRDLDVIQVAHDFVALTGFFYEDDRRTLEVAAVVLQTFAVILHEEMLKSPYGLAVKSARDERNQARTEQYLERALDSVQGVEGQIHGMEGQLHRMEARIIHEINTAQEKPTTSENDKIHARIDVARDLLKGGKPSSAHAAALQILNDVEAESIDDPFLRFRIATVLGSTYLELGNLEKAYEHLLSAYEWQPRSADALANLALVELLNDDVTTALKHARRALEIDSQHAHAKGTLLSCLASSGGVDELEAIATEIKDTEDSGLLASLGVVRFKQGRYTEAEDLLRRSLDQGGSSPQIDLYLGSAIFAGVQERLQKDPPLYWRIELSDLDSLAKADAAFTSAVDQLAEQEGAALLTDALASRAAVRVMLGRDEDAIADVKRALERDSTHRLAVANMGLLLLARGEAEDAIDFLRRTYEADPSHEKAFKLAQALGEAGRPKEIPELLKPWLPDDVAEWDALTVDVLLHAYEKSQAVAEIEQLVGRLLESSTDPSALWVYARHLRRTGDSDGYLIQLRQALGLATRNLRERIIMDLADALFDKGEFGEAASLYREVVDPSSERDIGKRYITALYNSGSLRLALELATSMREAVGGAIPVITEIEALVLARIGEMDRARELFVMLAELEPDRQSHRLQAVLLAIETGNKAEAGRLLKKVDVASIENDPRELMQLAHARMAVGEGGVLPLAYRARRLAFDDPEIHLAYVGAFLNREEEDKKLLDVETVGLDTAVHLRSGDGERHFLIVDEDLPRRPDELPPEDSLAQRLIGLRKGDEAKIREGIEELTYEVTDVQSKYVFAFQETLLEFGTRFPEHEGLHRFQVADDDLTPLIRVLEAQRKQVETSLEFYRSRLIPISTLSKMLRKHPAEVWIGLLNDSEQAVKVSTGGFADFEEELENARKAEVLVLDTVGFLTAQSLELVDSLLKTKKQVVISQAVADEIRNRATDVLQGPEATGQLRGGEPGIVMDEFSPEQLEEQRTFYENILEVLNSKLEIRPTHELLDLDARLRSKMEDTIGKAALSSALLAKELAGILYTDDFALRALSRNEYSVKGTWTQPILELLRDRDLIDAGQHRQALSKLAAGRCLYLRVTPEVVLDTLRDFEFASSQEVTRFVESIFGTDYGDDYVTILAADVIRNLWLEPLTNERKLLVLDLILAGLTRDRVPETVLGQLERSLDARLMLLPTIRAVVFETLRLWHQRNRIMRGLNTE